MKKLVFLSLMMIGGLFFLACEKDEGASLYTVDVEVVYPEGYTPVSKADVPVALTNMISGIITEQVSNDQGVASFQVEAGNYNVSSTFETDEFSFSGITENQAVNDDGHQFQVQLNMMTKEGRLVISEVFFAGSTTPEGTSYNGDPYVEIYNNSDEVIYADGLCIGIHAANTINPAQWVDSEGDILDQIPIAFQSWMVPGTGEDHPVQPRSAIVIALDGLNHQEINSNSPVDLSAADFEAYVENDKDVDNPSVTNMIQIYTTSAAMTNWMLDVNGRAIITWRLPTGLDYQTFVDDAENFMLNPTTGKGFLCLMVHKEWVVDAVEIVRPEEDRRNKQLPAAVDAGFVWNPNGRGFAVRRKVEQIIDGKVFLKDTNNSSEDWIGGEVPVAGEVPSVVD